MKGRKANRQERRLSHPTLSEALIRVCVLYCRHESIFTILHRLTHQRTALRLLRPSQAPRRGDDPRRLFPPLRWALCGRLARGGGRRDHLHLGLLPRALRRAEMVVTNTEPVVTCFVNAT
jgi:hypothetical protein